MPGTVRCLSKRQVHRPKVPGTSAPEEATLPSTLHYECSRQAFCPDARYPVRWLDWEGDYDLARTMWPDDCPLTLGVWREARELGYRYCAAIEGQQVQSIAAVWRYSETAWEVAAVRTRPEARRRGYAKSVVSYATAHILDAGVRPTCTTAWDNVAMQRTAQSVGFQQTR